MKTHKTDNKDKINSIRSTVNELCSTFPIYEQDSKTDDQARFLHVKIENIKKDISKLSDLQGFGFLLSFKIGIIYVGGK